MFTSAIDSYKVRVYVGLHAVVMHSNISGKMYQILTFQVPRM